MEPEWVETQRAAIREVRARYEGGELSFETFQRAVDAVLLTRNADECAAILAALPSARANGLAALDDAPVARVPADVAVAPAPTGGWTWLPAIIGEVKKMRRPWRLAPRTLATALVGEVRLDLSLAALPPRATIRVAAVVGEAILYVPRTAHVTVRGIAVVGEVDALGERSGGIVTMAHEEHVPEQAAETELEITVLALVGEVRIVLVDGPVLGVAPARQSRLLPSAE